MPSIKRYLEKHGNFYSKRDMYFYKNIYNPLNRNAMINKFQETNAGSSIQHAQSTVNSYILKKPSKGRYGNNYTYNDSVHYPSPKKRSNYDSYISRNILNIEKTYTEYINFLDYFIQQKLINKTKNMNETGKKKKLKEINEKYLKIIEIKYLVQSNGIFILPNNYLNKKFINNFKNTQMSHGIIFDLNNSNERKIALRLLYLMSVNDHINIKKTFMSNGINVHETQKTVIQTSKLNKAVRRASAGALRRISHPVNMGKKNLQGCIEVSRELKGKGKLKGFIKGVKEAWGEKKPPNNQQIPKVHEKTNEIAQNSIVRRNKLKKYHEFMEKNKVTINNYRTLHDIGLNYDIDSMMKNKKFKHSNELNNNNLELIKQIHARQIEPKNVSLKRNRMTKLAQLKLYSQGLKNEFNMFDSIPLRNYDKNFASNYKSRHRRSVTSHVTDNDLNKLEITKEIYKKYLDFIIQHINNNKNESKIQPLKLSGNRIVKRYGKIKTPTEFTNRQKQKLKQFNEIPNFDTLKETLDKQLKTIKMNKQLKDYYQNISSSRVPRKANPPLKLLNGMSKIYKNKHTKLLEQIHAKVLKKFNELSFSWRNTRGKGKKKIVFPEVAASIGMPQSKINQQMKKNNVTRSTLRPQKKTKIRNSNTINKLEEISSGNNSNISTEKDIKKTKLVLDMLTNIQFSNNINTFGKQIKNIATKIGNHHSINHLHTKILLHYKSLFEGLTLDQFIAKSLQLDKQLSYNIKSLIKNMKIQIYTSLIEKKLNDINFSNNIDMFKQQIIELNTQLKKYLDQTFTQNRTFTDNMFSKFYDKILKHYKLLFENTTLAEFVDKQFKLFHNLPNNIINIITPVREKIYSNLVIKELRLPGNLNQKIEKLQKLYITNSEKKLLHRIINDRILTQTQFPTSLNSFNQYVQSQRTKLKTKKGQEKLNKLAKKKRTILEKQQNINRATCRNELPSSNSSHNSNNNTNRIKKKNQRTKIRKKHENYNLTALKISFPTNLAEFERIVRDLRRKIKSSKGKNELEKKIRDHYAKYLNQIPSQITNSTIRNIDHKLSQLNKSMDPEFKQKVDKMRKVFLNKVKAHFEKKPNTNKSIQLFTGPSSSSSSPLSKELKNILEELMGSECVICMDDSGEPKTTLPCSHKFHYHCIDGWKASQRNPKCPVCREPITFIPPARS